MTTICRHNHSFSPHLPAVLLLDLLDGVVGLLELAMGAALHRDPHPGGRCLKYIGPCRTVWRTVGSLGSISDCRHAEVDF